MSTNVQLYPDAADPRWLPSSNVAYNVGDLLYDSGASGIALPAGSQASQLSEAADQQLFASKFIGVCVSGASAAQTLANTSTPLVIDMGKRVWNVTCPSQTFNHGDYVGVYSDGVNPPDPQKVDACGGNPARAIGRVFGYYGVATTTVQVIFDPQLYNSLAPKANKSLVAITAAAFAIPPHVPASYIITRAAADLMTLAAPTATTDDGLVISVYSSTAFAHTITTANLLQTGSANVAIATFAAQPGAGLTLMAFNGKWLVLSQVGITFS